MAATRPAQGLTEARTLARPHPWRPKPAAMATTAAPHGGTDTMTSITGHARPATEGSGASQDETIREPLPTQGTTGELSSTRHRHPPPTTPRTPPGVPPTGDTDPGTTGDQEGNTGSKADDPHPQLPTPVTIAAPHGETDTMTRLEATADSGTNQATPPEDSRPTDVTIGGPSPTRPSHQQAPTHPPGTPPGVPTTRDEG